MPRSRIIVEFADRADYAVRIGGGLVASAGDDVRAISAAASRCLVIHDADSAERCLPALRASLQAAGFGVSAIMVPVADAGLSGSCLAELHQAFSQLDLPSGSPVVVCAGVQASQLAAFAVATYAASGPLVVVPASLAAALSLVGTDAIELDAGYRAPLRVRADIAHAIVDVALLNCDVAAEAALGLDDLSRAAACCDAEFGAWLSQHAAAIARYDEDACVLALTQVLAARADVVGLGIAARI